MQFKSLKIRAAYCHMTMPDSHVHTSHVMASSYRWFSVEKPAYLPDPDAEKTEDKATEVREVNKAVLVCEIVYLCYFCIMRVCMLGCHVYVYASFVSMLCLFVIVHYIKP